MAKIEHRDLKVGSAPLVVDDEGKTVLMNKQGTVRFSFVSASVSVKPHQGEVHEYRSSAGVIEAPHGAKILPYYVSYGEWHVVMVEQFRIALPGKTIEPAGGGVDEENPRQSMARELEEEARIVVRSEDIDLVYCAYIQPPLMRSKAFGGIVKIEGNQVPREMKDCGGEWQFGEYTVVCTYKLLDLLGSRDDMSWTPDLETYLLLDAVAKKLGFLTKSY